jgi:hypothetical protein
MKFAYFSHIWAKPGMTTHERYEQLWHELELCDALGNSPVGKFALTFDQRLLRSASDAEFID